MAKSRFYLFARDKDTNNVKAIGLSDFDVYGFGNSVRRLSNSLEAIDYMSLGFASQEELVCYLVNTGRIDNYNTDLFIVSRNGDKIHYLENVYAGYDDAKELRGVGEEKLKGLPSRFSNHKILDDFAYKMINDRTFYRFIESKCHNVYLKYINYFKDCNDLGNAYQLKYRESSWAVNSYPLIRNIVEAMDRYEKLKKIGGSISNDAFDYQIDLNSLRDMSKEDISVYTDKGYGNGQLSLFIQDNKDDKLGDVSDFLHNLDSDSFILEDNEVVFNKDKFDLSYMDYKYLNNLDKNLMRSLYIYLVTKRFYEIDGYGEQFNSNITIEAEKSINKLLSENSIVLNKAYAFCLLYSRLSDKKINNKIYQKVKGE